VTATQERLAVTEPGVYDIPEDVYHADPVPGGSLSSTGARTILDCPAKFDYQRTAGQLPKREFELGHAAHKEVLGVGKDNVALDFPNYKTKAAQEEQAFVRAQGKIPLLPHEVETVAAMAEKIREHPIAGPLFTPGTGLPEQSLFWRDEPTGVMLRARFDWLRHAVPGHRLVIPDYKTSRSAHPDKVQKAIAEYGYHIQGAWYRRLAMALGLAPDDCVFVLVAQEKTPPYLVTVVAPAESSLKWGDQLADHAIDIYRHSTETGHWRGYSDDVETRELPRYIEQQYEIAEERGDYDPRGKKP
jgi:PDDEXK-like domain of unknown function (DUF3799)